MVRHVDLYAGDSPIDKLIQFTGCRFLERAGRVDLNARDSPRNKLVELADGRLLTHISLTGRIFLRYAVALDVLGLT
jgi:hypothetical protein